MVRNSAVTHLKKTNRSRHRESNQRHHYQPEAANGRNVVALGVTKAFAAAKKTAVFRPAVCRKETFTDVLLEASNSG